MNPGDRDTKRRGHREAGDGAEADTDPRTRSRAKGGARRPSQGARAAHGTPPETVEEALAQALVHGRNAVAESLLAGRALLDAASIGLTGQAATSKSRNQHTGEAGRALVRAAAVLDGLSERIRVESPDSGQPLVQALLDALDVEIARWEAKTRQDQDARAVLRAFLGLRELLWELGMRPTSDAAEASPPDPGSARQARPKARKRREHGPSPRSKPSFSTKATGTSTHAAGASTGTAGTSTESANASTGTASGSTKAPQPTAPRRKRVQRVEIER